MATSACGVCGKDSIEAIRVRSAFDVAADQVQVSPAVLAGLPDQLREAQRVFRSTGGLHAAGLFTADGTLLALREDVGRHNAVDKLAGWALRSGLLPLAGHVLLVSGRASFELAQKAVMMGVPVLAAVSAPSSLAASLAAETGMTLIGFLRGTTMNVYTGEHRVIAEYAETEPAETAETAAGPAAAPLDRQRRGPGTSHQHLQSHPHDLLRAGPARCEGVPVIAGTLMLLCLVKGCPLTCCGAGAAGRTGQGRAAHGLPATWVRPSGVRSRRAGTRPGRRPFPGPSPGHRPRRPARHRKPRPGRPRPRRVTTR